MLKIWKNYYLDASSVYYALKKAHTKADGGVEYDICTYHARLEEALAEAVRRTIREGIASGELKEWEQPSSSGWRARRGGCCSPSARRTGLWPRLRTTNVHKRKDEGYD